jgi:hypothetical protein
MLRRYDIEHNDTQLNDTQHLRHSAIMTLSISIKQRYAECHMLNVTFSCYDECHYVECSSQSYSVVMLNVVMMSVVAPFLRHNLIPYRSKLECLSLSIISILV